MRVCALDMTQSIDTHVGDYSGLRSYFFFFHFLFPRFHISLEVLHDCRSRPSRAFLPLRLKKPPRNPDLLGSGSIPTIEFATSPHFQRGFYLLVIICTMTTITESAPRRIRAESTEEGQEEDGTSAWWRQVGCDCFPSVSR